MGYVGAPHGSGSNHANAGAPDLPIEPRRVETVQEHRDRMAAKAATLRGFTERRAAAARAAAAATKPSRTSPPLTPNPGTSIKDQLDLVAPPAAAASTPTASPARPRPTPPRHIAPSARVQRQLAAVTAYTDGDSLAEIAAREGCAIETVRRWLTAAGVTLRPQGAPRPALNTAALTAAYTGGETVAALAAEHGTSERSVSRSLRESGVVVSSAGRTRIMDAAERAVVVAAYNAGDTVPAIAARQGRTASGIRKALRVAGVEMRDDRAGRTVRPKVDDPALVEAVTAAYTGGLTIEQVAETVEGVGTAKHARGILVRAGVAIRPAAHISTTPAEVLDEVLRLKAEGLSDAAIGEQVGYSQPTVSRWLRKHATAASEVDQAAPAPGSPAIDATLVPSPPTIDLVAHGELLSAALEAVQAQGAELTAPLLPSVPEREHGTALRVYISGPMSGYPHLNYPAFFAAEELLRAAGHEPLNPARNTEQPSWADYLRLDLADVLTADQLAVLPGWEASRGARLEVHVAHALEVPVLPIDAYALLTPPEETRS